ncbi:MAG: hypothetical protein HYY04_07620 [Chloroflexi bacterium]|nr:hypothetical protein [Chloroflexota bacterium]
MSELMQPTDANPSGNVHGGAIMKLVDTAAAVVAQKHARCRVVTARIDSMSFLRPVYVGELVTVSAAVNEVGHTSLEVGVRVDAENLLTGEVRHVSSAYLVFVALDRAGRPRPVPPLIVETTEERRRMAEAKLRREHRLRGEEAVRTLRGSGVGRRQAMSPAPGRQALVIGHRGAAGSAPENTLVSFERAMEIGVDVVELDVHRSLDNHLVVIHDHTLDRTTNGTGLVCEKLVEELRALDAGGWRGAEFAGQRVVTLDEVLAWARGRTRIAIEIKNGPILYTGIEEQIIAALAEHSMTDAAIVVSFDHLSIRRIRELSSIVATGVLYAARPVDPVALATAAGADALLPQWAQLTEADIEAAHRAGLAVVPWTVNDSGIARRLLEIGVDGITSDCPEQLLPLLGEG